MDSQNNQNQNQNSSRPSQNASSNNMLLGILAYLGPLVIISYLLGKDNDFVKFHVKQGLIVFGIEVIGWLLTDMMYSFYMFGNILHLATLILSIIGIINVVQNNKKELPLVGGLVKNLNF